uniref:Uncharacterized protein n=1 Tax=Avena sativa TaxID=4498 RepID=A0ACD5ZDR9_AVESA
MLSSSTASSLRLHQPTKPHRCRLQPPPPAAASHQFHSPTARLHLPAVRARRNRAGGTTIRAIDAAQPFDYESRAAGLLEERQRLKIAIVGFGNFGQFLARTFARQGHTLLAHSRSDYSSIAASLGASYFQDPHDLCECHPDVVLLATSILSAEAVLRTLPLHRLRRNTLFVDVLSVKEFPRNLLLGSLPEDFDVICTHPMFGPESARDGWDGLPFVFDKVRVGDSPARRARAETFLNIFEREGCRMVEMPCADHDAHAAETQFLTHTVGRMLATLDLRPTPIDTKGYETLLRLVDNTCSTASTSTTAYSCTTRTPPTCSTASNPPWTPSRRGSSTASTRCSGSSSSRARPRRPPRLEPATPMWSGSSSSSKASPSPPQRPPPTTPLSTSSSLLLLSRCLNFIHGW